MISYIDASQRHTRMSDSLPPSPLLLLIQWSQLNILGSNYVSLHRQGVVTAEGKGTEALKEVDVGGFRVAELGHSFFYRDMRYSVCKHVGRGRSLICVLNMYSYNVFIHIIGAVTVPSSHPRHPRSRYRSPAESI